jgi:hypothetical protein
MWNILFLRCAGHECLRTFINTFLRPHISTLLSPNAALHEGDKQLQSHLYWATRADNACALPVPLRTNASSTLSHPSFLPNIHHISHSTQHKKCTCQKTSKIIHPVLIQEFQFDGNIGAQLLEINFVEFVILLCLFKACCVCISPWCLRQQFQVRSVGIILYSKTRKMILSRDNWITPVMQHFWSCCWIMNFSYGFLNNAVNSSDDTASHLRKIIK